MPREAVHPHVSFVRQADNRLGIGESDTFQLLMAYLHKKDVGRAGRKMAQLAGRMAALPIITVFVGAVLLAGCAASTGGAELPSLEKDKRQLLSKAEQQKVIADLAKAKEDEIATAQRKIEQGR